MTAAGSTMAKIAAQNARTRSGREFLASEEFMRKAIGSDQPGNGPIRLALYASEMKTAPLLSVRFHSSGLTVRRQR
jgi:hypothetical protein